MRRGGGTHDVSGLQTVRARGGRERERRDARAYARAHTPHFLSLSLSLSLLRVRTWRGKEGRRSHEDDDGATPWHPGRA